MRAILIVEDDPDDVTLLVHALRRAGVTNPLAVCASAEEARAAVSRELPALLVVDVSLETGETGLDLLTWVRAQPAPLGEVPAVVLTGAPDISQLADDHPIGAVFCPKAMPLDLLAAVIQTHLRDAP